MKNNFIMFFKTNWAKIILLFLCIIVIVSLALFFVPNWFGRKNFADSVSSLNKKSSIFYLSKIYCYSSATGLNAKEGKAMWNIDVSQYTDIALSLNIHNVKDIISNDVQVVDADSKYSISKVYIDNISFSNNNFENLSLSYIPFVNFGLITDEDISNSTEQQNRIDFNIVNNKESLLNNVNLEPSIDEDLILPITLRYLNKNIKTGHVINNIEESLTFDGSILKRASIPLSSIKNDVSFTIHIINKLDEDYSYPVSLQIPLQNSDGSKSIYDGNYSEETNLDDSYFY